MLAGEGIMRICSLLPSATEIVYALGLGDRLVAVTHECDTPPEAATKPRITRSAIDPATLTSAVASTSSTAPCSNSSTLI
jgi:ABC-type hemin transport system substrate-binding protein